MKKFLFAVLAAFIAIPAQAGEFPDGDVYSRISGKRLTPVSASTSLDAVAFGFTADVVRMCVEATSETAVPIYIRVGTTVTNVTASLNEQIRVPGSNSAAFINGVTGADGMNAHGAMVIAGGGDGTDLHCTTVPLQARGIVMHIASGQASVDVTGFQKRR